MNGFYNTYQNIFTALKRPELGRAIDTPANPQDWQRFFGMMETLERAEIATFQNGRYVLHPKRKADIVAQAQALLAEISKPLSLPVVEAELPETEAIAEVSPQFNVCPRCAGKGRVNIEDELGFFGNFLCLICYGEGKIPVPSRSTFPPVDLTQKPTPPDMALFQEAKPKSLIPQTLEVGSVRVIVEAPALVLPSMTAEEAAEGLTAIAEITPLVPATCTVCYGFGNEIDEYSEHPRIRVCPECGGTGEEDTTDYSDWPSAEEINAGLKEWIAEKEDAETSIVLDDATQPLPVIDSPQDEYCETCGNTGSYIIPDPYYADGVGERICSCRAGQELTCSECQGYGFLNCLSCNGSGIVDTSGNPCSCKPEDYVCFKCKGTGQRQFETAESIIEIIAPVIDADPKRYVRINTTGRGMSSGSYELIHEEERYGRKWMVVKFTTDKDLPHHFPAEICELVAPKAERKVITPVIVQTPKLLEGLPIFQAVAEHGKEATKEALNIVAATVIAEALNGNQPVLEGMEA